MAGFVFLYSFVFQRHSLKHKKLKTMAVDKKNVLEIFLGVAAAMLLIAVLTQMFGGYLSHIGSTIHGADYNGKPAA